MTVYLITSRRTSQVLYVGSTDHLWYRATGHKITGPVSRWIRRNGGVVFDAVCERQETPAKRLELRLVRLLRPPLNTYLKGSAVKSRFALRKRKKHSKAVLKGKRVNNEEGA